jgi:hypothetical protein
VGLDAIYFYLLVSEICALFGGKEHFCVGLITRFHCVFISKAVLKVNAGSERRGGLGSSDRFLRYSSGAPEAIRLPI